MRDVWAVIVRLWVSVSREEKNSNLKQAKWHTLKDKDLDGVGKCREHLTIYDGLRRNLVAELFQAQHEE